MTAHRDEITKQGYDCVSWIKTNKTNTIDGEVIWYTGPVLTPNGIVYVMESEPARFEGHYATRMVFIHDGKQYWRKWLKQYQPRYLTNLARKFAEDVVAGTVKVGTHDDK